MAWRGGHRGKAFMQGNATTQAFEPRYIRLDANDNVAIVVNDLGLPAKTRFPCGLELRNFVPQGHKVALSDIPEGAPIRRYNEVIGTAAQRILAGEWVDEARIQMPTPPELDKLELATVVPAPASSA
jgi:galactarate dehydratase